MTGTAGGKPASSSDTATAGSGDDSIRTNVLGDLDPGSVGVLDANSGGFGVDMWRGTPRSLVEALMPDLVPAANSSAAHGLFRRLLLSAAETPSGPAPKNKPSLLALRLNRLLAEGDVLSARKLLQVVPTRHDEEGVARARVEVAFLTNDNAGACTEVRNRLDQYFGDFWRKSQVFCQLLSGDTDGAGVGASLLQEQGVDDPAFFALVRMLSGEKGVTANGLHRPTPLDLAMMRAAKVQIPAAVITDAAPQVLRTVAMSPNADLETRLEAAEGAEARGAMKTDELRQLYLSVNFAPKELANALSVAEKLSPVRGRALLYHAVTSQSVPAAQAEIVAKALSLAKGQGRVPTAVRVFLPTLEGIEPRDGLAWFAPAAASALYLGGAYDAAGKWYALAKANSDTVRVGGSDTDKGIPAGVALWPLAAAAALPQSRPEAKSQPQAGAATDGVAVASGAPVTVVPVTAAPLTGDDSSANAFDEAMFERWWKAMAAAGDETRVVRAQRVLAVLEALGAKVGEDAWAHVVTAPAGSAALPAVGVTEMLARASAAGRTGETVLLALTALGSETPAKADPRRIGPVVKSLADVGLADDARALSIEAVYGGGI